MIWKELSTTKKPFFVLAPMDDVTDSVFRRIVASCAKPDLFFTEFVSVDGLNSPGRDALWKKLEFEASQETPLIAQVWGLKPENYYTMAKELSGLGFAGIDINMGCPAPVVVKNGACSALINNKPLAKEIIEATIEGAGDVPVSVKTRIGFNQIDIEWPKMLLETDIKALTIHGRTTKEMSKVPNHWDVIKQIVEMRDEISPNIPIIGNGDVLNVAQGIKMSEQWGVDGIMIGRGVFHDPYVFSSNSPWENTSREDKLSLYEQHINLFLEFWGDTKNPASLKKFAKVYINGFAGASEARAAMMECRSASELLNQLHLLKA